jgi:hypothetical protein
MHGDFAPSHVVPDDHIVRLTVKRGFETVMVLSSDPKEEVKLRGQDLLAIEQAINTHTDLRACVDVVDTF